MAYDPASNSDESVQQLPVSLFLTERPQEFSQMLVGVDTEGDESRDKAYNSGKMLPILKAKMGWYKVPCQSFYYGPATLDSLMYERGVKEPEGQKVDTAMLIRMEREACTLELISSFGDMAGASSTTVIKEALENPDLSGGQGHFSGPSIYGGVLWPCHFARDASCIHFR